MIAAGLAARKALSLGLRRKPWVKTSFAPGSKVVEMYLRSAGLMAPLEAMGFGIVGFACTSCNGMSGPLAPEIEEEIITRKLHAAAVLSGNRNFNGRIHPRVTDAFLASPAMVVAYAIAGTIRIDIANEVLATDADGRPVTLADLWPSDEAIDAVLVEHVRGEQFCRVYDAMFGQGLRDDAKEPVSALYAWKSDSTYIRRPPFWEPSLKASPIGQGMRAIAVLETISRPTTCRRQGPFFRRARRGSTSSVKGSSQQSSTHTALGAATIWSLCAPPSPILALRMKWRRTKRARLRAWNRMVS